MKARRNIWTSALLLVGILLLVNLMGREYFFRIDLTASNKYTLSKTTTNLLDSLKRPITITTYTSKNIPTPLRKVEQRFKELLHEYRARAEGMVDLQFKEVASDNKKKIRELAKKGIKSRLTKVRKKGKQVKQRVFMGATVKLGGGGERMDLTEEIPFIGPKKSLEYELTTSLRKVTELAKPDLALLQGHGEASLPKSDRQSLRQMLRGKGKKKQGPELAKGVEKEWKVLHNVQKVKMTDTTSLHQYETVAIVSPQDSFPRSHLRILDRYLRKGGKLLLALNRVDGRLRRGYGRPVKTGLGPWLAEKGINVKRSFLLDQESMQMRAMRGKISIPYYPKIKNFSSGHPITKGLELAWFKFASPISVTPKDSAVQYQVLARSSENASTEGAPTRFKVMKQRSSSSYDRSGLPIAVAAKGPIGGKKDAKLVVIGDGDFPLEGNAGKSPDNVNLMANSMDWLAGKEGIASLRSQGIESRPIKADLSKGEKSFLRHLNFLSPFLIIMIIGALRWYFQAQRRLEWKAINYVQTTQ
ncbi:MAG: GldG family protein [Flavobacteriales bacterium]